MVNDLIKKHPELKWRRDYYDSNFFRAKLSIKHIFNHNQIELL